MKRFSFCAISIICALCSCTQEAYEKGDGKYSYTRADFVEAHADGQKQIDYVTTDDGETLPTSPIITPKWVQTADSVYRCLLYYNKVDEGSGRYAAETVSISQVTCPRIKPASELKTEPKTDPVKFESAWTSKSGKYLNLSLYVMTGSTDDDGASQTLGIVCDTLLTNSDATRTCHLRFCHDQGGVPEYYSSQLFVSIPIKSIDADSVRIDINTYKGTVSKTFLIR